MALTDKAESFLRRWRSDSMSTPARYLRGEGFADVSATQGSTRVDVDTGDVILKANHIDWIIDLAELKIAGNLLTPLPGDRIQAFNESGQVVATYEVAAIGTEPCYVPHGRDRKSVRIHTIGIPQ